MMKNAFYFTLKAPLVLWMFNFFSKIFGHVRKRLDQTDEVNFKMYDVTVWLTNNYRLHNISGNNGNQALEFCEFTEHNMRNI